MVAVASSPAMADRPTVQITDVSSTDLPSGGRTTLSYTVTNTNLGGSPQQTQFSLSVTGNGLSCSGDCSRATQIGSGETKQFTVTLAAGEVAAGQTKTIPVVVRATVNNDTGQATQQITVRGPDKPQTVSQVTGRVKDQDGKPVPGASVGVRDCQGHSYTTTTNDDGRFRFTSTDQTPILACTLSVGTVKQGFEPVTVSVQGAAGKVLNVPLTLRGGETTTSAPPSASASCPSRRAPTQSRTPTAPASP